MPVWHEKTKALQESGDLLVLGITQEQHPERCALYASWKELDWPILWDPFNLLGCRVVPDVVGVNEEGVVWPEALDPRKYEEQFLGRFLQSEAEPLLENVRDPFPELRSPPDPLVSGQKSALRSLLFNGHGQLPALDGTGFQAAIDQLELEAQAEGVGGAGKFRLGVAYRMRHDSAFRRPGDFQRAVDAWFEALAQDPGQYIWRRRIQQWGPRLDKPYPFYDWIPLAQSALLERGEAIRPLQVSLSASEVATGTRQRPSRLQEDAHPDPKHRIPRDQEAQVQLEWTYLLHTGITSKRVREPDGTARIHLRLEPDNESGVRFDPGGGPIRVWVDLPAGWETPRQLISKELAELSGAAHSLEFEIRPPPFDARNPPRAPYLPAEIRGTVFYPVCTTSSGVCHVMAQDFKLELRRPIPLPAPAPEGDGQGPDRTP